MSADYEKSHGRLRLLSVCRYIGADEEDIRCCQDVNDAFDMYTNTAKYGAVKQCLQNTGYEKSQGAAIATPPAKSLFPIVETSMSIRATTHRGRRLHGS